MIKYIFLGLVLSTLTLSAQMFEKIETKDKCFSIIQPIGWQKLPNQSAAIDFGIMLPDKDPVTLICMKEKDREREVIAKIKASLPQGASMQQGAFKSATGNPATLITVTKALQQAGSFVYQYYYIFPSGGNCYALIGTSGACPENGGPLPIFNSIATTAKLK